MKNRKGLTLIEVVLAMLILSILLVTYITAFGQSAVLVSRGKNITNETFNYQDIMENNMVNMKAEFNSGGVVSDGKITIFSGSYKSEIDIKKVETKITDYRKFIAFVSNFEIKEPKPPKLDPFMVRIYDKGGIKEVFPWKDDNIRLVAEYTVKNDPLIFENRTRWYGSTIGENNPVFASDYSVLSEEEKQEPGSTTYKNELAVDEVKAKRFYYFEARPYTFAGRIEHFKNNHRILVLNRGSSPEWQDFMEDIYFENNKVKDFTGSNQTLYLDIMQNPDHPTLNLDWSENSNPEGALIGIKLPDIHVGKNFTTSMNFQFDNVTLNNSTKLGIGIGLVNDNNTGIIIDLEPLKDTISVNSINKGKYGDDGLMKTLNTKDNLAFKAFRDGNGGLFDWSKEYSLIIQYHEEKLIIQLESEDVMSEPLEMSLKDKNIEPKYIGLKSYSNNDYMPNLKYEIINKYDRNYSSHFYGIEFERESDENDDNDNKYDGPWTDKTKNVFYSGNSNNIEGNNKPKLNIKMTKENTESQGTGNNILAKAFWFAPEVKKIIIHNHSLSIKAEKIIFDVPIQFTSTSYIEISGINNVLYPVRVYFKEGEKIKINNGSVITLKKGQYISIKSGYIKLNSNNDSINITGLDVMLGN